MESYLKNIHLWRITIILLSLIVFKEQISHTSGNTCHVEEAKDIEYVMWWIVVMSMITSYTSIYRFLNGLKIQVRFSNAECRLWDVSVSIGCGCKYRIILFIIKQIEYVAVYKSLKIICICRVFSSLKNSSKSIYC